MPIDSAANPCELYGCSGPFVAGLTWSDARGPSAIVITEEWEALETGNRQGLRAQRFMVLKEENIKQTWRHIDATENWCDNGLGLVGDVLLTDLNDDGVAEVTFVYNIEGSCDVSPIAYRLVLHTGVGEGELEIRGDLVLPIHGDVPSEIVRSPALEPGAGPFAAFADSVWKARVR